jgi:hypothetical protein
MSLIAEVASQLVLSLLLTMLSWGWTITYLELGDVVLYAPLFMVLLIVHMTIAGATQITNDAYHKYHDYEGIQGLLLVISRIGIFIYFLFGMRSTYTTCRAKAKSFIKVLGICGSAYLLSFPTMLLFCYVCAPYVRHKVLVLGTIVVQSAVMAVLMKIFSSKSSYTAIAKQMDPALSFGKGD